MVPPFNRYSTVSIVHALGANSHGALVAMVAITALVVVTAGLATASTLRHRALNRLDAKFGTDAIKTLSRGA